MVLCSESTKRQVKTSSELPPNPTPHSLAAQIFPCGKSRPFHTIAWIFLEQILYPSRDPQKDPDNSQAVI